MFNLSKRVDLIIKNHIFNEPRPIKTFSWQICKGCIPLSSGYSLKENILKDMFAAPVKIMSDEEIEEFREKQRKELEKKSLARKRQKIKKPSFLNIHKMITLPK